MDSLYSITAWYTTIDGQSLVFTAWQALVLLDNQLLLWHTTINGLSLAVVAWQAIIRLYNQFSGFDDLVGLDGEFIDENRTD